MHVILINGIMDKQLNTDKRKAFYGCIIQYVLILDVIMITWINLEIEKSMSDITKYSDIQSL